MRRPWSRRPKGEGRRSVNPRDRIAHGDTPIVQNFAKRAPAPVRPHDAPQARQGLVHPLARLCLPEDPDPARADPLT
jgi:hypothetical protein